MKVRAGAKPNGKVIEVELDDNDGDQDIEGWSQMSLRQKFRALSEKADFLLIEYMMQRGDISKEFAAQRIREIKGEA